MWGLNYICVSTDLELSVNEASEGSERQVTQGIAGKVGDKGTSCVAWDRFAGQVKPKCLEKEPLTPDGEDVNDSLKLSSPNGILIEVN